MALSMKAGRVVAKLLQSSHGLHSSEFHCNRLHAPVGRAAGWTAAANVTDIEGTLGQIGELTKIAETEIHAVVLSCTRARRKMLAALPARRPNCSEPVGSAVVRGGLGAIHVLTWDF